MTSSSQQLLKTWMFLSLVSEWPKIMAIPVMLMIQKIILIHGAMMDGNPNEPPPFETLMVGIFFCPKNSPRMLRCWDQSDGGPGYELTWVLMVKTIFESCSLSCPINTLNCRTGILKNNNKLTMKSQSFGYKYKQKSASSCLLGILS